jgi:predicted unusual protein kinase regulating ubiquinone biosynthesis (AarF/ABC1/UbiB family)
MQPLKEVTSPIPKFELTSRKVLVMEWINGTKLI